MMSVIRVALPVLHLFCVSSLLLVVLVIGLRLLFICLAIVGVDL
jgi:hypothetical protein